MTIPDEDWRSRGACLSADPELFFPLTSTGLAMMQLRQAKAVCERCPVQSECLQSALSTHPVHGIWGGTSERERQRLWEAGRGRGAMAASGRYRA